MQKVHCDMEECSTSEAFELDAQVMLGAGSGGLAPKGWAIVQWSADGPGEHSRNSKLMASYFRALGATLPRRALAADPGEVLGRVADEMGEPPPALITFRAYVCPGCMGKLALGSFSAVNRMPLQSPLFG